MDKHKNEKAELKLWAKDDIVPSDLQGLCKQAATSIAKLQKRITELEAIPRCPCGGELEGIGYDKRTKEVVFECKKCHAQLLLSNDVWEQALKGN